MTRFDILKGKECSLDTSVMQIEVKREGSIGSVLMLSNGSDNSFNLFAYIYKLFNAVDILQILQCSALLN